MKSCQTVVMFLVQSDVSTSVTFVSFFFFWNALDGCAKCSFVPLLNSDLSQTAVTGSPLLLCAIPNQGHVPPSLVNGIS